MQLTLTDIQELTLNSINGRNNSEAQCISNTGLATANAYKLENCSDTIHSGVVPRPCAFHMSQLSESRICGRFRMWIHGCQCCSTENPTCDYMVPLCGTCSEGCIVIPRDPRIKLRTGDYVIVENYEPIPENS